MIFRFFLQFIQSFTNFRSVTHNCMRIHVYRLLIRFTFHINVLNSWRQNGCLIELRTRCQSKSNEKYRIAYSIFYAANSSRGERSTKKFHKIQLWNQRKPNFVFVIFVVNWSLDWRMHDSWTHVIYAAHTQSLVLFRFSSGFSSSLVLLCPSQNKRKHLLEFSISVLTTPRT